MNVHDFTHMSKMPALKRVVQTSVGYDEPDLNLHSPHSEYGATVEEDQSPGKTSTRAAAETEPRVTVPSETKSMDISGCVE